MDFANNCFAADLTDRQVDSALRSCSNQLFKGKQPGCAGDSDIKRPAAQFVIIRVEKGHSSTHARKGIDCQTRGTPLPFRFIA